MIAICVTIIFTICTKYFYIQKNDFKLKLVLRHQIREQVMAAEALVDDSNFVQLLAMAVH